MKRMNKLKGMMMAVLLLMTYILPIGTQMTWAAETQNISFNSEMTKVMAESTLEKGDRFSVILYFNLGGISEDNFKKGTKVVGIKGSASEGRTEPEVSFHVDGATTYGKIQVKDLVYTGKGSSVEVAVRYMNEEIVKCPVPLDDVEELIDAGLALKVGHNNVVNVKAGETQQIQLTLVNNENVRSEAGKMELSVKEKNTTAKNIKLTKTKYDIPELSPGESKDYNITLSIDKEITRGIHEMEVKINDTTTHTVQLKVESDFMPPSLELTVTGTEDFKVNKPKDMTINLKNVGQIAAKNVKLEVVPNEKVYVLGGSNVKYIDNIDAGRTQNVQIKLQVSDPSATTVPLQLKFSYTDDLGQKQEDSQYVYLNTEGALLNKEVVIDKIIEPTGTFNPNQNFTLKFTVSAENGAKNVKISVNGTDGIIAKSKNLFIIPEIKAGQKTQYSVTLAATSAAKTNAYPIEIKASYKLNNEDITISQYGSVNISNPEADEEGTEGDGTDGKKKGTPKVIVGEYKSNPVVVKAGEEFDLEIGFLNTNATKSVNNLKANITVKDEGEKDTGNVFTPVGASNTFYIASLAPGQTEVKKIRLYTIPSAKPKTYQITIEMEYEDEKGYEVKTTEMIGIPVEQVTKLEIAEVQMDVLEVGRPSAVTATLYNTGKTDISNVMIQVEGEGFTVEENKMFIGNFEQGASEMYTPTIMPNQAGQLEGKIVIEYEDSTGQIQTLTHELTMDVMDVAPMPEDMGGMDIPEPEKPSKLPTLLGVGVGIALAAIITLAVIKKRKNKLSEMEIDED